MKLAEALQERADLATRIAQLHSRIRNNALVQQGEQPAEDPAALLDELEECIVRQEDLMTRINLTNSATVVGENTLTALLSRRDCLKQQLSILRDLVNTASQTVHRARNTEIVIRPAVDVPALQKRCDDLSKALRLTDNLIQQTNWLHDLM